MEGGGVFGSSVPALTNYIYENLVLETWFGVKKLFTVDTRTRNTTSWRKGNLPYCDATLHAPRIWASVQTCLEQRKHTVSGATCHLYKLTSDSSVSYVAPKQKDDKGCDRLVSGNLQCFLVEFSGLW